MGFFAREPGEVRYGAEVAFDIAGAELLLVLQKNEEDGNRTRERGIPERTRAEIQIGLLQRGVR